MRRRDFLAGSAAAASLPLLVPASGSAPPTGRGPRVAAIVTEYRHNDHADVIVSRIFQGWNLDDRPPRPNLDLVSVYTDQVPAADVSRRFAARYGFRIAPTIADALTGGGPDLAVDGVLLIGEQGNYPWNPREQQLLPRRRFFEEIVAVFRRAGRVVPVFCDKGLGVTWDDARSIVATARAMKIPLMAGSSIPLTWRHPPADVDRGAPLAEAVCLSYHVLFTYGFHALEMLQCLAERRRGGETGVRAVRCVDGAAVWRMARAGAFDRRLFQAALDAREHKQRLRGAIEEAVARPSLMAIEYRDGFKATVLTLNPVLDEWVTAWRRSDRPEVRATVFVTQEFRPLGHFRFLLAGIERMFQTDQPTWPVERTLLTTGILDAALTSRSRGGTRIETPHLAISYRPTFDWHPPPPPVPDRPLPGP